MPPWALGLPGAAPELGVGPGESPGRGVVSHGREGATLVMGVTGDPLTAAASNRELCMSEGKTDFVTNPMLGNTLQIIPLLSLEKIKFHTLIAYT